MESNELKSLITLLDDPDNEIYAHVAGKLLSLGPQIIPSLESYWESSPDPLLQQRIELLIHSIHFESLKNDLSQWLSISERDLLEGALLVARYRYHDLDKSVLKNYLDIIKRSIWLEMNHNLTPYEQINVFNHVFFGHKGYSGKAVPDINCYFINKVIESKTGNAVSLGVLYQTIARELDIPIYGVNLPLHYVLAYCKTFLSEQELEQDQQKQVLFYFNPMNKGAIFTRNEVKAYLEKINHKETPQCFQPCSARNTIQIMLEHLHHLYVDQQEHQRADEMMQLLRLF